jgi:nucleoside-diphosphate-sugar epimerase
MPSTLLTGANSFFAAHLLNQLVSDGHTVTGTVRSLSKGKQLLEIHPEWKDHVRFVEVTNLSHHGTWDTVIQQGNFDYVIHNAAPMPDSQSATDFDRDFLEPSVAGCVGLVYLVLPLANHWYQRLRTP